MNSRSFNYWELTSTTNSQYALSAYSPLNTLHHYNIYVLVNIIIIIMPLFQWGNWGSERLNNLLKITELASGRTKTFTF